MNTHDFILKQVEQNIRQQGFGDKVAKSAAEDALDYYMRSAMFRKGAMADTLAHAKKRAKQLDKLK